MKKELRLYVQLQQDLCHGLCAQFQASSIADVPRNGEIQSGGGTWTFQRHGSGVLFRDTSRGTVVDVHDAFDQPDLFDVWRLRTYLGSLGKRGTKCIDDATGTKGQSVQSGLQAVLSTLERGGDIQRIGQHFRLVP